MKLRYDPFPFVFAQGDISTKLWCLELFGLGNTPHAKELLLELLRKQRADGASVSQLDGKQWGMRETVRNALLMLKLGMPPGGVNVCAAVMFVLEHPCGGGGWCENPALEIPPFEQSFLSNESGVTWLTADVVDLLRQTGMEGSTTVQAAVEWLRGLQNEHGGWPGVQREVSAQAPGRGDPDVTAQITFLMRELYGEADPSYVRGRELFEHFLSEAAADAERGYHVRAADGQREDVEVYGLTHLLLSWLGDRPRRIESGYDVKEPRVRRMMQALVACQAEDGGWRPFWSKASSASYTVLALKTLVLSGAVARDDLIGSVRAYATGHGM